ncbi:ATP-binding protein [Vibrio sp. B1FLJ16]|uniref:hybrid sensor histidine kinase/response regulator n=1 Tax=Vibrio sp. B1FLJ16 TaxID=2751178 RepID=UPI001AF620FF|nr:ATP-binding protein [Vibrio sp. B1FLJ16]CAD7806971.1 His Kinase A (phosphoacceptor) domain [Vibrio sp. B1FLJ16]CAE6904527.1 His Kinase A (phosphoacceptor) domain [Vibrio sp. B1FLJ16]
MSFLVLEALGGTITLNYGVTNSLWAILAVALVVIFSGIPICYYAAKHGVDIDLLSRGAGFGYIGSTIVSLIYASFTFIFFALEAAIMSMAIELLFNIPLAIAYVISSVIVIPLVVLGITNIGRFQMWSQPIWLMLQIIPLLYVFTHEDAKIDEWLNYTGVNDVGSDFNWLLFGSASAVLLSVVAQIGEQVDFLRFLPAKERCGKLKWWSAMLLGGPGWMIFGSMKLVLGSFLAWLAISHGVLPNLAGDPAHMYFTVFSYTSDNTQLALLAAGLFVIISQLKINVANAYAGSLAWSNFFSRLTHHHPGRVVWMVFNVLIALLLMELGVYQLIEQTLQVYSVLVLAWIGSIVADLVINKPLGLSPKIVEFKRSKLYDVNPVGVGSMLIASGIGITAHLDFYGELTKAFASYIAFAIPFITAPLIAMLTKSRYYLVNNEQVQNKLTCNDIIVSSADEEHQCSVCEHTFEHEDMALCPAYGGHICSLCCSLDVRCQDNCRPEATFSAQMKQLLSPYFSSIWVNRLSSTIAHFVIVMLAVSLAMGAILALAYSQIPQLEKTHMDAISNGLVNAFALLLIPIGIISWLFVLARTSNRTAVKELKSHTALLTKEVNAHHKTSQALQQAKRSAETANNAKSRYLASLSHELRTPLNILLGYAQLLSSDNKLDNQTRQYAEVLKRNGKHLSDMIEGLLEISKIEAGRLELHRDEFSLTALLEQLVSMFSMQAQRKGLNFEYEASGYLPTFVATDKQRLRQILINLLGNAIKYTESGTILFKVSYRNQVVHFTVQDTGIGLSEQDLRLIFKPFERIKNQKTEAIPGSGLGLTISNALAEIMGGEISCTSKVDHGSAFVLKLMLPEVKDGLPEPELLSDAVTGYLGKRKTIMVVDDIEDQRQLISRILTPLGFNVLLADNAPQALKLIKQHHVDLFMLDIFMPQVNGWQLAIQLRKEGFRQPILMLSANIQELETNNQLHRYHNDYLTKPVSVPMLLAKINRLLDINWLYDEADDHVSDTADVNAKKQLDSIPSYEQLIKLKEHAEIGFLSGVSSELEKIEQALSGSNDWIVKLKQNLQECNFNNIILQINGIINEHYYKQ